MPCLLVLLALITPRLVIVLLVLFGDYIGRAYETTLWPLLGFLFMPFTTLAYAVAMNENGGSVSGGYMVLVILGVVLDLSASGGGASHRRTTVVRKGG